MRLFVLCATKLICNEPGSKNRASRYSRTPRSLRYPPSFRSFVRKLYRKGGGNKCLIHDIRIDVRIFPSSPRGRQGVDRSRNNSADTASRIPMFKYVSGLILRGSYIRSCRYALTNTNYNTTYLSDEGPVNGPHECPHTGSMVTAPLAFFCQMSNPCRMPLKVQVSLCYPRRPYCPGLQANESNDLPNSCEACIQCTKQTL